MEFTKEEQLTDLENLKASVKAFETDVNRYDWDTIERISGQSIAEYKNASFALLDILQKSVGEEEKRLTENEN